MFVYSKMHDRSNKPYVKQILVFSSGAARNHFDQEYKIRVEKEGSEKASDYGIGAIYALRVIQIEPTVWVSKIRCAVTGKELWEGTESYDDVVTAMMSCCIFFRQLIKNDVDSLLECAATDVLEVVEKDFKMSIRQFVELGVLKSQ